MVTDIRKPNLKGIVVATIAIAFLAEPGLAQPKQYGGGSSAMKKGHEMALEDLKTAPQLPDLPEFTGQAHFVKGTVHQGQQGPSYIERFLTKEDKQMVIDWYKNTLNMYKWKITGDKPSMVAGEKDGSWCVISVCDAMKSKAPDKTELSIDYFQKTR